jgi:hypothetical protein
MGLAPMACAVFLAALLRALLDREPLTPAVILDGHDAEERVRF